MSGNFDVGSWTLEDLICEHGAILPQEYGFKLLQFFAVQGSRLEDNLEYFEDLRSEYVFIDRNDLKVANSYLWSSYVERTVSVSA